ncbi:MAG TPA: AarF/UbiB family protein [Pseudonocardiaceae bacterium]
MQFLLALVATALSVVFVLLLAVLARQILGVPVGWFRSIVFGYAIVGLSTPVMTFVATKAGFFTQGHLIGNPVAGFLIAILAIAWMFALGLTGLVILEAVLPTGSIPDPITLLRRWRRQRRRVRRYAVIVGIAVRHGLGRFFRAGGRADPGNRVSDPGMRQTAIALRRALEDAGVAFVKLGQMLSTRPDLLHPAILTELTKLQTQVEPAPWTEIEPAIRGALDRPIDEVFRSIEPTPLAAASVGQVHEARLLDGRAVVIKVQRPAARRQIAADLDIILQLARRLDRVTGWGRSLGIRRLAEGFADSLTEELDYGIELDNTRAVAGTLRPDDRIVVPRTYPEFSGQTLMVMEKLDGIPIADATTLLAGFDARERNRLAADILGSVLRQIIVSGVFHADLHPGNLLIRPDRTVGLLDFGSVGRLDQPARTALGLTLYSVERDDPIAATGALIELLGRPEELDQRELERSVGEIMVRYRVGGGGLGMFTALFRLVMAYQFAVPSQVAAAFRAMGTLEGTLAMVCPGFDLLTSAREQSGDLSHTTFSMDEITQTAQEQLMSLLPVVRRLPHRINKITEDLENGRFTINIRMLADQRDRAFITGIAQQVMTTILAAAAAIAAIMLLTSDSGPMMTSTVRLYVFLGYALLFVGFVLGLRVLVRVFFRRWRE